MSKETIIANGKPEEVEVGPLTLLCHRGDIDLQVPGRVEMGPQETVQAFDALSPAQRTALGEQPLFAHLWKRVFTDRAPAAGTFSTLGERHVAGLILLLGRAACSGKQPFIRLPESYLHPAQQAGLADLFVLLGRVKPEALGDMHAAVCGGSSGPQAPSTQTLDF